MDAARRGRPLRRAGSPEGGFQFITARPGIRAGNITLLMPLPSGLAFARALNAAWTDREHLDRMPVRRWTWYSRGPGVFPGGDVMTTRASGTFEVKLSPRAAEDPAAGALL